MILKNIYILKRGKIYFSHRFTMASTTSNSCVDDDFLLLTGLKDPRNNYIKTSDDFCCLQSASGGHIERILRNIDEITLFPKCGTLIETQTFFPGDIETCQYATAALSNRICKLNNNYWLANENHFSVKEGELATKYEGRIKVIVFNKTADKIIIKKNSAIAVLITSLCSYADSAPSLAQYNLF